MAAPTQINKLLFGSFTIFIGLLFSGQLLRLQIGTLGIAASDIGIIFLLCVWISQILVKRVRFKLEKSVVGIIIFLSVCVLSLLVNLPHLQISQALNSFLYILRFTVYACLFPIVRSLTLGEKSKTIIVFEILGALCVILGFFQFIFYPSLRNLYYLGWDEDLYRLFSVFLDPNFAAAFLSLFSFFLIYRVRNDTRQTILHGVLLGLTILALILTFSRSGIVMFLVGITIYLFLYKKLRYLLLIFVLLAGMYMIEAQSFSKENQNLFRTTSSLARVTSASTALSIFQKNPILGVGFNAYRYAQIRYGYREEHTRFMNHADAGADSSLLFVLATTGVLGFCSYLFMWKQLLFSSLATLHKPQRSIVTRLYSLQDEEKLILVSVVALFVDSFFINSLFYPFLMSWMWVLLGIMA